MTFLFNFFKIKDINTWEEYFKVNFIRDFTAGITNVIGGRATEYEEELIDTRAEALNEMIKRAEKIGANAIIGTKVDYETIGEIGSMLMVVASGTAVVIE